ncbi:MAG: hypothetical protein IPM99_07410 [Rubrivivax sp.]|nr:hypothetical protein [Rubrivivax sp.]
MLVVLRELIGAMERRDRLPQIELAAVPATRVTALVLRHLEPLSAADAARLRPLPSPGVQWWLQPKGPETVHLLDEGGPELAYALPEFGVRVPADRFTQVNPHINRVLVARALGLLALQASAQRVVDSVLRPGQFRTLPLATRARQVHGIDGSDVLVQRATTHAPTAWARRRASRRATCSRSVPPTWWRPGRPERWLVDRRARAPSRWPRRCKTARRTGGRLAAPLRIIVCQLQPGHAGARRRAAGAIQAGYRCTAAGWWNINPHPAHVEPAPTARRRRPYAAAVSRVSIAVFDRHEKRPLAGPSSPGAARGSILAAQIPNIASRLWKTLYGLR